MQQKEEDSPPTSRSDLSNGQVNPLPTLHLSHPSRRHQKTRRDGGAAAHGWPDEGYVARLRSEAAAIGLETATEGSSLSETAGEGGAAADVRR